MSIYYNDLGSLQQQAEDLGMHLSPLTANPYGFKFDLVEFDDYSKLIAGFRTLEEVGTFLAGFRAARIIADRVSK